MKLSINSNIMTFDLKGHLVPEIFVKMSNLRDLYIRQIKITRAPCAHLYDFDNMNKIVHLPPTPTPQRTDLVKFVMCALVSRDCLCFC